MNSERLSYKLFALSTHARSGCALRMNSAKSTTEHIESLSRSKFLTTLNISLRDCGARRIRSVSSWALRRVALAVVSKALGLVKVGCPKIPVGVPEEKAFFIGSSKKDIRVLSSTVGGDATVTAVLI